MTVEDGMLVFISSKDFRDTRHIHEQVDSERFGFMIPLSEGRFGFPILDDEAETFLKMHT